MKPIELPPHEILETVSDAIVSLNDKLRYVYANSNATKLLGTSSDEMLGRRIDEVFPEIVESSFYAVIQRVAQGGKYEELNEYYAPHESWYNCRFHPLPNGGVTIFFTDSTEERRTNHRLRLALEGGKMGIWEHSFATGMTHYDERIRDLFEMPPGSNVASNEDFVAKIHPDDRSGMLEEAARALEDRRDFCHDFRIVAQDNSHRWIEGKAAMSLDSTGQPISMVGLSFDITRRKSREQQLERRVEEGARHFRLIAESVPGFFVVLDERFRFTFVNRNFGRAFGRSCEEIMGRSVREIMGQEHWDRVQSRMEAALAGEEQNFEFQLHTPELGSRFMKVCYMPQHDASDVVTGIFIQANDISEEYHLRQEVLNAQEQEKVRIGMELHSDLCQRLTGIGFDAQTLTEKLRRAGLEELAGQSNAILQRIKAATKFTRLLARGMAPISVEAQNLREALSIFLGDLKQRHPNVQLNLDLAEPTRELGTQMATQLYIIALEAVSNALTHGEADRVDIHAWTAGSDVFLTILDNGIGDARSLADQKSEGFGLRSMDYRARSLGGSLRIETGIGGPKQPGVQIICRLPGIQTPPA